MFLKLKFTYIRRSLRLGAAALCMAAAAFAAQAVKLPVGTVDGRDYYLYQTSRGETLADVISSLGVTRSDIIRNNPSAAEGLKSGQLLLFPVDEFDFSHDTAASGRTLDGVATTNYVVKKGESLFGLSHRFGVSADDIAALNPHAANGVKPGMVLRIPDFDAPVQEIVTETAGEPVAPEQPYEIIPAPAEPERRLRPVDTPVVQYQPESDENADGANSADTVGDGADDEEESDEEITAEVAILLPFMLDSDEPGRQAQLYTEFMRGLLMAADTLASKPGVKLNISAYDTANSLARVDSLMRLPQVREATVVIAPDTDGAIAVVAENASRDGSYVFSTFNVRDTLYMTNPAVIQANIPHTIMYRKAVDALMQSYRDYKPVILSNLTGQADKAPFIAYLRDRYSERGIEVLEVGYEGSLHASQLDSLDSAQAYVLIPTSGSLGEFNKISHVLRAVRETRTAPTLIFGYPDWLAFRGEPAEMLHRIEAVIFSRVYDDGISMDRRNFADSYRRWYGTAMSETVPNQAILGFDTGCYIIENLRRNDGDFNPAYPAHFRGMQSSFEFLQAGDESGWVNNALYIITFLPDRLVSSKVL